MFEDQTYELIIERMLNRIPDDIDIDKRENSVMWNALSPAAAELAQAYIWLDALLEITFADTSSGDYLTRRASEFGVNRKEANKAIRKGVFRDEDDLPFDVPIGSRFFIDNRYFVVINRLEVGQYSLECEVEGTTGNKPVGDLLPIDNIAGLAHAELTDILVSGEDEESDMALLERYIEAVNEPAFGGNISDYKVKVGGIQGVGGVKVFPVWQGGGTVKCTIISSDFNVPSPELVSQIQTIIDPEVNQGEGIGLAPISHTVTIAGTLASTIDVSTTVTLADEVTVGQVQSDIEEAVSDYLLTLRKSWKDEDRIVVRIAQIDARLLSISGIVDIKDTKINGLEENIELSEEEIPVPGQVIINE